LKEKSIEIPVHRNRVVHSPRPLAIACVLVMAALIVSDLRSQDNDGPSRVDTAPTPPSTAPGDHDHAGAQIQRFMPNNFTPEQRVRIERLFKEIICKCPKEGWTKTLEGCPDGCADQQKNQVRVAVQQGISDAAILATQESAYGPRVLARTRAEGLTGFFVYFMPFIVLAAFSALVVVVLVRLTRRTSAATESSSSGGTLSAADREWDDEIERELEEMD
jgi:cytochrome c-type biogenesis protein CcmH/NrfF